MHEGQLAVYLCNISIEFLAGIYIHIPFCKQACHYCDFHFSTNLKLKPQLSDAIIKELDLRKDDLGTREITSIYFGGGTPSLLSARELNLIMAQLFDLFAVHADAEITLEANPDDLNEENLFNIKNSGINRLSIGIQTFDEERLKYINRAHSKQEATNALLHARKAGFENITADLIYAIPPDDLDYWERDLRTLIEFDLPHLSIYGLTIEEKTVFGKWAQKGRLKEVDDDVSAQQYQMAMDLLTQHGYEHYEVSNFSKPGRYSRHNSAYWEDQKYLGIGPGAHSYNGDTRSHNISNNALYLKAIQEEKLPLTLETLTATDRANEYLFTHLRTKKGIDVQWFYSQYGRDILKEREDELRHYMAKKLMEKVDNKLVLTSQGFMLADEISLRLFYEE